jgi:hypothetical protein
VFKTSPRFSATLLDGHEGDSLDDTARRRLRWTVMHAGSEPSDRCVTVALEFFVAIVIVGNTTEHGSAVLLARRGRVPLAVEIPWPRALRSPGGGAVLLGAYALLAVSFYLAGDR